MSSDWKNTTWGELATLEYGKGLTGYESSIGDIPVYGTNGKIGWHTSPLFDKAGVIIGRKGAYRGVHYSKTPFFVIDTAFYLKPKTELDLRWAYYQLLTQDINSMDSGSAIPSTSRPDFYSLTIKLPPLPEQRAIAEILGTLDDKIEINHRMNTTLESMARAVFKEWFIENKDVEKWETGKVEDICISIENGGTPKRMEPDYWNNGTIAWFKTGELNNGALIDSEEKISELGLSNSACRLWNPKTILIALYASPTVGRLGILELPGTANQACSALIAKPEYGYLFLFYSLLFARDELQRVAVGAAQQNINQSVVKNQKIRIPPPELAQKFHKTIEPLYLRQVANLNESRTFASLRDSLLPKMMRGEVRVKNVEIKQE